MAGLGNFLGAMGATYEGFNRGSDQEKIRQFDDSYRDYNSKVLAANKDALPEVVQAAKTKRAAEAEAAAHASELAKVTRPTELSAAQAKAKLAPTEQKTAELTAQSALAQAAYNQVADVQKGAQTQKAAQDWFLSRGGEALASGDLGSVNTILEHAAAAPNIFPGLNGKGVPVKTDVTVVPEGAKDWMGNPISGQALQLTMKDGSTQFINPKAMLDAYQKTKSAEDAAGSYTLNQGQVKYNRNNQPIAAVAPKADPLDLLNAKIDAGFGVGGSGGSGSGRGKGNAPATASSALEDLLKRAKDVDPSVQSRAMAFANQLSSNHQGIAPDILADIAFRSANDQTATQLRINPSTGTVDRMFIDKNIDRGRPFVVAQSAGTIADIQNAGKTGMFSNGKEAAIAEVGSMLKQQSSPKMRDAIIQAAQNPQALADLEAQIKAAVPEAQQEIALGTLRNKVSLVQQFPEAAKAFSAAPAAPAKVGGVTPPAARATGGPGLQMADPTSRAGKWQARQESLRQQGLGVNAAQVAKQQELSRQFQSDAKAMTPIELSQKYDSVRASLPQQDAQTLWSIEKQIR